MFSADNVEPLRIGVAGLGRAGTFHIERLGLRSDCRLVAACDDCPQAVHKAAGIVPRFADSWADLLRDESVELVLVATPPATHAALTIEALSAGKHVLVETPLCLDLVAADAILLAERRHARSVVVAHTRRWDSAFLTARECVASGVLGGLRRVKQIRWQYSRPALGAPVRTAAGPPAAPDRFVPHDWRSHTSTGGGALWEFGVHDLDQLLRLVDEKPSSVIAELFPGAAASDPDDGFLALVSFASGLRAHIEFNRASPAALQTGWMVVGSAGSFSDGTLLTVSSEGEVIDQPFPPVKGEVDDLYAAIVRHLRGGAPNPVPAEQSRRTIALIEAARQAARSGHPAPVAD